MADETHDLSDAIAESAIAPKRFKGDEGEAEQHSLADQIEADRYLASKQAAKGKRMGMRFCRMASPGANE